MSGQKRIDARRNYLKIVEAAEIIFSKDGAQASLEQIAKAAEVGIGTLYRHFPSRKDLLLAVYGDDLTKLIDEARKLQPATPPMVALTTWLQDTVQQAIDRSGFGDLIVMLQDDNDSAFVEAVEQLLHEARKAGSLRADITVSDILDFIPSIVNGAKHDKSKTERMLSVVIDGLRKYDAKL